MAKKKNKRQQIKQRAEPKNDTAGLLMNLGFMSTCPKNYKSLAETPEIKAGVEKIAELISTMTIHLMQNGDMGDIRLFDGLAKKIDINPNSKMTRQLFISWIVQEMLLNGNAVVGTQTKGGLIEDLIPIPKKNYTFEEVENDYVIRLNNNQSIKKSSDILNFRFNPKLDFPYIGQSQEVILKDLISDLAVAKSTVSDFMQNKMLPSVVVKVDALTDELTTENGRKQIERQFLDRSATGEPWIIPAGLIDIKEIKPLTLNDIAIHDSIKINKQTVASILGMPAFLLGVGDYNKDEYNNFIRTKIAVICKSIEQELTDKLIISNDRYFQFNRKSMLNYDIQELGSLYLSLFQAGIVTGNEVRDVLGMSPKEELKKLIMLENYIPAEKIGEQEKLGGAKDE